MLCRNEADIRDVDILQHHVQEPYQHILVRLAAEHPLEHEVTEQVCILLALTSRPLLYESFAHVDLFKSLHVQSSGVIATDYVK